MNAALAKGDARVLHNLGKIALDRAQRTNVVAVAAAFACRTTLSAPPEITLSGRRRKRAGASGLRAAGREAAPAS